MYLTHLCPPVDRARYQMVLDAMARLCPDVIAAVQEYIATWGALPAGRVASHPMAWVLRGPEWALLEVFVTDTRQQAPAAYERNRH
jgi:hypothetical protein